jgi:hypothetical protein
MQIICAALSLRRDPAGSILVPVIGLNQQAAAALVSMRGTPAADSMPGQAGLLPAA